MGRRSSGLLGALGALLCVVAPSPARAQPPPRIAFQLDYVLGPRGDKLCPNAKEMRDALMADFGYSPVQEDATWRVTVAVNPGLGRVIQATMELRDPAGNVVWRDHKKAINDDCDTLVSGVSISIRISIDRLVPPIDPQPGTSPTPAAPEPKPEPEPPTAKLVVPEPAPAAPEPVAAAPARPDSRESSARPAKRPKVRAGLGTTFALGDAPDLAVGFTAQVGVRWPLVSISLEGRGDIQPEDGGIETGRISGTILPCGHHGILFGCVLGTVGRQSASYENEDDSAWYGGGGVWAGVELPVVEPVALRLSGDVMATTPTGSMMVGAMERWSSPTISGVVTVGVVADF